MLLSASIGTAPFHGQCTHSSSKLRSHSRGIIMVGKGLTESDMLEIVYKSHESFSDSGNDSVVPTG